jgi:gluconolactonase
MSRALRTIYDVTVVASDLDHPECVAFGPDGRAYAGGEAGQLFRFTLDGATEMMANTGGGIGGLCVDGDGNVYECNYILPHVHRVTPSGEVTVYSRGSAGRAAVVPNFPVFDSRGNLYYSDSGDFYKPSGCLFVVRPDGTTEHLAGDHLHFPNGLALDAGEAWLYVIQSTAANIVRYPLRDGAVGAPEIFITLPGTVPDGLAFAASGNLYVACYVPDVILRVTPDRHVETVVEDRMAERLNRPTNVAFAPESTRLLFANLGGQSVNALDVGEKGAPLRYPSLRHGAV